MLQCRLAQSWRAQMASGTSGSTMDPGRGTIKSQTAVAQIQNKWKLSGRHDTSMFDENMRLNVVVQRKAGKENRQIEKHIATHRRHGSDK